MSDCGWVFLHLPFLHKKDTVLYFSYLQLSAPNFVHIFCLVWVDCPIVDLPGLLKSIVSRHLSLKWVATLEHTLNPYQKYVQSNVLFRPENQEQIHSAIISLGAPIQLHNNTERPSLHISQEMILILPKMWNVNVTAALQETHFCYWCDLFSKKTLRGKENLKSLSKLKKTCI